ncbi:MAG: DUF3783 domain-containing protein [Oscillospiraceae bacterium]|nr:DUF3783 domain-containing protein [Oscillospiraceae bacterium]
MAQALLFNISGEKRKKIHFLLFKLGVAGREIPEADFGRSLGELSGREGFSAEAEDVGETFTGEMLVMDGLNARQFNALLDGLRQARAQVALKAVITEENIQWSANRLYRELSAEHEAMQKYKGKKSVHGE